MAHRYRLYPTPGQEPVLVRHCSDARFVWNVALEQCRHARRVGRYADQGAWDRQLAEARREFPWLGEGSSSVQQGALRDLRQAFRNWWSNPAHFRAPGWRKAGVAEGFVVRDLSVAKVNRKWATVVVPKAGRVRFRLSRPLPAGTKSARVTLDRAGRWHVSFTAPQPPLVRQATGAVVGLDMGVAATVTTSDGEHLGMPVLLSPGERARRLRLQRRLARQQNGSNRRAATKAALARLSAREADRRNDWIEQTTTALVRGHDVIAVEDLRVKNMVRSARGTVAKPGRNVAQKRGLNRSIHSQAWARFRLRLEQKAAAATDPDGTPRPVAVVAVNPANTSRRCSDCGHSAPENRKSQAVLRCGACGHTANADVNAAINILAAGLAVNGRGAKHETSTPPGVEAVGNETSTTRGQAA